MLDFFYALKRGGAAPKRTGRSRQPRVPGGRRIYAIGDIHGRADLLDELLRMIDADAEKASGRRQARNILVFLGDYIDRGPASSEVIDRLIALERGPRRSHFLLGNHEEALLRILGGDAALVEDWLSFGGAECLRSYGVDAADVMASAPSERPELIRAAIPSAHREFLERCEDSISAGDYLFVHAGIRPGFPLSQQRQRDLRWIREPFLSCRDDHGAVVVHGHSISADVDWQDNRIGIDTGAYKSGVLTALVLSGSGRRTIQAGAARTEAA